MSKSVLVLGASGMLGHKMLQTLSKNKHTVCGTVRGTNLGKYEVINEYPLIGGVDGMDFNTVSKAIDKFNPDVVVNCIGIIKQLPESNDPIKSLMINTVLPHKLALLCNTDPYLDKKLIHISTDCVFDGKKGMYKESDIPNATDLYGVTKTAGEVRDSRNLTLRTSIIGRELITHHGLVEWFLSNRGKVVNGYTKSIFSGVTTQELSHIISRVINEKTLTGLYHVASSPINKYELLTLINQHIDDKIEITPIDGEIVNRSLDGNALMKSPFYYNIQPWKQMVEIMMNDPTPYDDIRRNHVK
jgi:dTDP-4-dehydrorhamnose reductase